jgi:hypothetical protein
MIVMKLKERLSNHIPVKSISEVNLWFPKNKITTLHFNSYESLIQSFDDLYRHGLQSADLQVGQEGFLIIAYRKDIIRALHNLENAKTIL